MNHNDQLPCLHKLFEYGWRWVPVFERIEEPTIIHALRHKTNEDLNNSDARISCVFNDKYQLFLPGTNLSMVHGLGKHICLFPDLVLLPGTLEWGLPPTGKWEVLFRKMVA